MQISAGDIQCEALYYGDMLLWALISDNKYLDGIWNDSLIWDDNEIWNE